MTLHVEFRFLGIEIGIAIGIGIDVRSIDVRTALLAISIAIPMWTPPTQDRAPCRVLFYRCHYNLQAR